MWLEHQFVCDINSITNMNSEGYNLKVNGIFLCNTLRLHPSENMY